MRLWSVHPQYLDLKGLSGVWREALLARAVLEGKTKGYLHHPQLERFKAYSNPLTAINAYLYYVWLESNRRGYRFDAAKLDSNADTLSEKILPVTRGQVQYEWQHLLRKVQMRDTDWYSRIQPVSSGEVLLHPVFYLIEGNIEGWERVKDIDSPTE